MVLPTTDPDMIPLLFLLLCHAVHSMNSNSTVSDHGRLKATLLSGYRRDTRPVRADTTITNVTLMLSLRQILDMDMRNEIISARMYIYMRWTDELLTWDPAEYGGLDSMHIYAESIWTPDITMYNEIHERGYLTEMLRKRLRVFSSGLIHWPSPISVSTSCPLDMSYFPWDVQLCSWQLGSWIYPLDQVDVHPKQEPINFTVNYVAHGEWELMEEFSKRQMTNEGTGEWDYWPTVTFAVRLRRRPLFFLVNLIMPSMMITILSVMAFFVPAEEGEKITVSITVLLASTVFLLVVNDTMPVQSYTIPIISEFYLAILGCLALATVATVFVTYVHHKGNYGNLMSPRTRQIARVLAKCVCMGRHGEKTAESNENSNQEQRHERNTVNEWFLLAKYLDRLFIVVFTILFLLCFALILK